MSRSALIELNDITAIPLYHPRQDGARHPHKADQFVSTMAAQSSAEP
jgi:hypothetical protein